LAKLLKQCKLFIQGFLLFNLLWFVASILMDTNVVPNPLDIYQNISSLMTAEIIIHILYSIKRIALGLVMSLGVGVPIGILIAYSKKVNKILYPLIYLCYPIPKSVLLPVAMLLWGMRDGSKVVIIFLIIVFQVIVSVRDSVVTIEPSMYQVMKSAGAGRWQIIRHVTMPGILPQLLTSIRISLGTAVSVLFFVEGYGTEFGLGYYILNAWSRINYIDMYMGILVISLMGFALFILIDLLSNVLCKWSSIEE